MEEKNLIQPGRDNSLNALASEAYVMQYFSRNFAKDCIGYDNSEASIHIRQTVVDCALGRISFHEANSRIDFWSKHYQRHEFKESA
ncbi:MAG: hypothetical protein AAF478_03630 [Pseudomonadota bacterium]